MWTRCAGCWWTRGWARGRPRQVTVILNPDSVSELTERIADLAVRANGTLLLCYVGRGVLSASGRLYLAVRSTRPDRPESTAVARDIPVPEHSGTDSARRFPFIANAAIRDVERAAILLRDAACAAHSIDRPTDRAFAMADIAEALAPFDPEQARRIAYAIPSDLSKPEALARVARALANSAPHDATPLLDDAHRLAGSLHDDRSQTLSQVVWGLARTDLDRAEGLASSITDEYGRAMAYAGIVRTLVLTHPRRRRRPRSFVRRSGVGGGRTGVRGARTVRRRPERLAYSITEKRSRVSALVSVAQRWTQGR